MINELIAQIISYVLITRFTENSRLVIAAIWHDLAIISKAVNKAQKKQNHSV